MGRDLHCYPDPCDPQPSRSQYAMIGEYMGIHSIGGKQWAPGQCSLQPGRNTTTEVFTHMLLDLQMLTDRVATLSAAVLTQLTDVESECNGLYNYDRTSKYNSTEEAAICNASQSLVR